MTNPFAHVTEARPSGAAGRVLGEIDESWSLRPLPQGGVVSALAARAMTTELADVDQSLRLLHTTFVAPVSTGPVEVEVEILRRGRSMSHARAEVRNPGATHGHLTTTVFGVPSRGFSTSPTSSPLWARCLRPKPRSSRDPVTGGGGALSAHPVLGPTPGRAGAPWVTRPREEYEPDRAEHATWYRLDEPPVDADGVLDPLALIVCADSMPGRSPRSSAPSRMAGSGRVSI